MLFMQHWGLVTAMPNSIKLIDKSHNDLLDINSISPAMNITASYFRSYYFVYESSIGIEIISKRVDPMKDLRAQG